ncbi:type IV pilus biogenesis/stability protein PilW [Saccharophagus sp. K07]|jgi:type IV pilus assembly protein PilF|uniref:type IV pilus biogenesis/stability protein PilW n=1 Tax=Saccharophagus sp. K07 TaxID=2283636 RepID=UPI001652AB7B|nr:type IV pilus biogenesis/stability protein PilW [Saccharophagus sp. K07]MBC6905728.1 type IV pilus biogenesis/stability protein PilW [Saccharophagus sp. K07]
MNNWYRNLLVAVLIGSLSACVTTSNKTQAKPDAAHDKRIELGMKYLEVGQRDNARWQFSKAMELKKNSAQAYHGVALVHQANGELDHAEKAFKSAFRYATPKELSPIAVSYGRYLMEVGEAKKACEHFEKAAGDFDYKARPEALYLAGQCAQKTGNTARVKPAYEHAINLDPQYVPPMVELAEIYFQEGEYAKSKRLLSHFEKLSKPTPASLWLGIRIERIFGNKDKEASYALALKNLHPYSKEYLEYRRFTEQN